MPIEFFTFVDNPKKEHRPMNLMSIILLIRQALKKIKNGFI